MSKENNEKSKVWVVKFGIVLGSEMEKQDAKKVIEEALLELYDYHESIFLAEPLDFKKGNIEFFAD